MKFVCCKTTCLKLVSQKDIIRMPFEEETLWCKDCYDKWADECPGRDGSDVSVLLDDEVKSGN